MTDQLLQLLTAYVDGELSTRQRKAVARLLEKSPEARKMLRRLQADREAIHALPRERLPADFAAKLLRRLPSRSTKAVPARTSVYRTWWPAAAAAAVILGIGVGTSLLVTDMLRQRGDRTNLASGSQPIVEPRVLPETLGPEVGSNQRSLAQKNVAPSTQDLDRFLKGWQNLVQPLTDGAKQLTPDGAPAIVALPRLGGEGRPAPELPFTNAPILTAPPMTPASGFKTLDVKLALFLEPRNIDAAKLAERLKADPIHHIDLACIDSWKTFERLQSACRSAGIRLNVESELSQRLTKKLPTACMVYLENTSPDQILKLMQALKDEEVKAEAKKKGDGQIDSILVRPLNEAGRKELADALGVAPATLTPMPPSPGKTASPGLDPTKPISEGTIKSLEKLASKVKEPTAIALIYYANRTRLPASKELKQFQDARLGLETGAIHVVFYLRPSRG